MMLDVAMIVLGLKRTGKSKGGLAEAIGVRASAVSEILSGIRLIKASELPIITGYSN
jgi:repressor LexA